MEPEKSSSIKTAGASDFTRIISLISELMAARDNAEALETIKDINKNLLKIMFPIEEEQLETFLRGLADDNPAVFVELVSLCLQKCLRMEKEISSTFVEVLVDHPELLMEDGGEAEAVGLAEITPKIFDRLMKKNAEAADRIFSSWEKRLEFLARSNPSAFVEMLCEWGEDSGSFLQGSARKRVQDMYDILIRVACAHPGLLMRSAEDGGVESVTERDPHIFAELVIGNTEVASCIISSWHQGLEFLVKHDPSAFVVILLYCEKFGKSPRTLLLEVARQHPELLLRTEEGDRIKSLAEVSDVAFAELITTYPDLLTDEQLRNGMVFLAKRNGDKFTASISFSWLKYCDKGEVLVQTFEECPDILSNKWLPKVLNRVARDYPRGIVVLLEALEGGEYPKVEEALHQLLVDLVKKYRESFENLSSSTEQTDQDAYEWLRDYLPDIIDLLGEEPGFGCRIM